MKLSFYLLISSLVLLFSSQTALAQCLSDSPSNSGVVPEQIAWSPPGNQDCQQYSFFRLESVSSGSYALPDGGTVNITVSNTSCGPVFSVDAASASLVSIAVKGGPDSVNVYDYDTAIVSDGDLHSVQNTNNGEWYALSHIDFCYEPCVCLFTCPADITLNCGESTDPSNTGTASTTGDCIVVHNDVVFVGACDQDYTIERTWTAVNFCTNTSESCVQSIQVEENNSPELSCPTDVTVTCGENIDPSSTGTATATDVCSGVVLTYSDLVYGNDCEGEISRTWKATDYCGNTVNCTQTIQIVDNNALEITCPADVTVNCGEDTDPSSTGTATATDNCGGVILSYEDLVYGNYCEGEIIRTWTATDYCGNTVNCAQTIQIVDNNALEITCPADVTVNCGEDTDPSSTGTATATDNCGGVILSYEDLVYGNYCEGEIIRTWTATDYCGNTVNCAQTIQIVDNNALEIICPADVSVNCGEDTDPSSTGTATATDNCGGVVLSYDNLVYGNDCEAEIIRTWIATDYCENTTECEQIISVLDDVPPVIECPADITIDCNQSDDPTVTGTASATDNCSGVLMVHADVFYVSDCPIEIKRTWTVADYCLNTSTCEQTITLVDDIAPVFDEDWIPGCDMVMTATDNCDDEVEITCSIGPIVEANCTKTQELTYIATDDCGNTAERTFTLSWIVEFDDVPPVLECPADITLEEGASAHPDETGWASSEAGVVVTYRDELSSCGGEISRIWTARDACGNESTCTQILECSCSDGNLNDPKADVQEVTYKSFSTQAGLNGTKAKLHAYPNPSVNTIYFELGIPYESDVLLEIYDLKGQLIKSVFDGQMAKGTKHVSYQLDQLKAGTYMVKLTTNDEVLSQQVIKQ
jgi:hypothetical protein